jgi:hypothetical protein
LIIDKSEIVESDDDVGVLVIEKCRAEAKLENVTKEAVDEPNPQSSVYPTPAASSPILVQGSCETPIHLIPHCKRLSGGYIHVSKIMSSVPAVSENGGKSESDLTVKEALEVLRMLNQVLALNDATAKDATTAHLYLSEISHFGNISMHTIVISLEHLYRHLGAV